VGRGIGELGSTQSGRGREEGWRGGEERRGIRQALSGYAPSGPRDGNQLGRVTWW